MTWQKLIKQIRADYRLSPLQLADITRIYQSTLNRIELGKTKHPNEATIQALETGLNIKINDSDKDNITYNKIQTFNNKDKGGEYLNEKDLHLNFNNIPVVNMIRVGKNNAIQKGDIIRMEQIRYDNPDSCIAIEAVGDSMSPAINDGATVLIDKSKYIEPMGDIVVAIFLNNTHTIKKYRELPGDFIELSPINKNYQSKIYHKSEILAVFKCVRCINDLENGKFI